MITDFYFIALKKNFPAKMQYGQNKFDFDEGVLACMSPGQVFKVVVENDSNLNPSGWMLLIHPDFLWNTSLAKKIKNYEFFNYSVTEALFLSDKEETIISEIIENIQREYHGNMDQFSQEIIISQIESLLNYTNRFYHRQFITRKIPHHKILLQESF